VAHSARRLEQLLPALVLAVSAVSVPVLILSPTGLPRLRALKEEKAKVDLEVSRLGDQIRQLRAEVRHVRDDPAKVEQVARDQLGLLRQTEVVYQFGE
jgi:cell division protein FtsB